MSARDLSQGTVELSEKAQGWCFYIAGGRESSRVMGGVGGKSWSALPIIQILGTKRMLAGLNKYTSLQH